VSRQVGFVGLGNMGGRMTRRLAGAGISVVGYDLRPGQAAAAGATPADQPVGVCAGSECVLLSLPDSTAVEAVVLGGPRGQGLIEAASPGQVIVDLSTAAPASTRRLHAALAERGV
jgi:3-hydroxyisobutyrate dehydrogenase